jgi:hypothetical protein
VIGFGAQQIFKSIALDVKNKSVNLHGVDCKDCGTTKEAETMI